jgi:broad specificity phosphatase PhoE
MTTLVLIRHGQTDWIGRKLAGRLPNISLNDAGRAEADRVAVSLAQWTFAGVFASPLERAQETVQGLARRQGIGIETAPALQEVDFGELTGKTFEALPALEIWQQAHRKPSQTQFPGGESFIEVQQRAVDWAENLRRQEVARRFAACSHADTIRLLLAHYLGMPLDSYHTLVIDTASLSILRFQKHAVRILGINWPAGAAYEPPAE